MGAWSDLTPDLVNKIADQLLADLGDYVRLRAVCKSCRSAVPDPRLRNLPLCLIFFAPDSPSSLHNGSYCLVNPLDAGRIRTLDLPPHVQGQEFWGCAGGCIVLQDQQSFSCVLTLLNPITRHLIRLPPFDAFCGSFPLLDGLAVSAALARRTVMIAMNTYTALAAIREGTDDWVVLDDTDSYVDVEYYRGNFYALGIHDGVKVVDSDTLQVARVISWSTLDPWCWHFVEAAGRGELLIARKDPNCPGALNKFQVFKIDTPASGPDLFMEVKDLGGDQMLLMGRHCIASISARDLADGSVKGCSWGGINVFLERWKRNHIYFSLSSDGSDDDRLAVNLADDTFETIPYCLCLDPSRSSWFVPTLN